MLAGRSLGALIFGLLRDHPPILGSVAAQPPSVTGNRRQLEASRRRYEANRRQLEASRRRYEANRRQL